MSQTKELFMMEMMSEKPQLPISTNKCKISSQKPKKTIPPSWTKEDLKRQKREEGLFELGYEQGKQDGAKASLERVVKLMDSIAMGSPEEDLKQYWKLREKLKKEVNPDG